MRTLVITDIHGAFRALKQVLERSSFNKDEDRLICLGDVCDGWREVVECIQLLNNIPNLIYLMGNHDQWTFDWLSDKIKKSCRLGPGDYRLWTEQGGMKTVESIENHNAHEFVYNFLNKADYFFEENHRLFVHGGIDPDSYAHEMDKMDLIWDRRLVELARFESISIELTAIYYDEVFVGHTPTLCYSLTTPTKFNNVWMCDTGASYTGCLSIIDIDTKEFWQSDPVVELYPGERAR